MGEGNSSPEEGKIVFAGAKNLSERAAEIDVDSLSQHEVDSESAYNELKSYLTKSGAEYYQALVEVADRMDGRRRLRIPGLQKPGAQETAWEDTLIIREGHGHRDSFDFSSKLLFDKTPLDLPIARSYLVGINETSSHYEKGVHPQGLVTVTFADENIKRISIESRDYHIGVTDFDHIVAKKLGVDNPQFAQSNSPFGSFMHQTFWIDWANNRFSMELVFPGNNREPEIILDHKAKGNESWRKGMKSSYRFSKTDFQGQPEIAFRGTVHPKHRDIGRTSWGVAFQDKSIPLTTVREVFSGAMLLLPGQVVKK